MSGDGGSPGERVTPITDDERRRYANCGCCDSGSPWPCTFCTLYLARQRLASTKGKL